MRRSTTLIALAIFAVLPATAGAKLTRLPGTGETPGVAIDPGVRHGARPWYLA